MQMTHWSSALMSVFWTYLPASCFVLPTSSRDRTLDRVLEATLVTKVDVITTKNHMYTLVSGGTSIIPDWKHKHDIGLSFKPRSLHQCMRC